jgi:hypothetical protein
MDDLYRPACGLPFFASPGERLIPKLWPRCLASARHRLARVHRPDGRSPHHPDPGDAAAQARRAIERARADMLARTRNARERTDARVNSSLERLRHRDRAPVRRA